MTHIVVFTFTEPTPPVTAPDGTVVADGIGETDQEFHGPFPDRDAAELYADRFSEWFATLTDGSNGFDSIRVLSHTLITSLHYSPIPGFTGIPLDEV